MPLRSTASALALALALLGCAEDAVPSACSGPQECPPPSTALQWAAQLWPGMAASQPRPGQGQLTPQEEPRLTFDSEGAVALRFTASALLHGTLTDETGHAVARARLVAVLPSLIPGQPEQTFQTATDAGGAFSLPVTVPRDPSSQPYSLWVGFDDPGQAAAYPPLWRGGVTVSGDTRISLQLPAAAALATVRGNVLDATGNGVPGMRVQVIDASRRVVSSTALSLSQGGPDPVGSYRVLVDPSLTVDTKLQLVAWPPGDGAPRRLPILTLPLARPAPGSSAAIDFKVPPFPTPVSVTLVVSGTGPSGATLVVPGAQVQAQVFLFDPLQDSQQTATYVASGDTDSHGRLTLPLVPGANRDQSYTVTVQSPAESPLASVAVPVPVGASPGTITLPALPLRAQISGRLLDSTGQPVTGAQLFARSIPAQAQEPGQIGGVVLQTVAPQTTTDQGGRFALRLDQGDYDLDIVPVPGTQARFSVDSQRILTDDIELGYLTLPQPTLGKAQVLGPDGLPVVGASLRVFQLPDPQVVAMCALMQPCSREAALRAEVTTDSRGRAEFLLPDAPARQ